jgi:ribose transport system permease protein
MTRVVMETRSNMAVQSDEARSGRGGFRIGEFGWIWLATIALFLVSAVAAPGTVRLGSVLSMLPFAAMLAIVAMGQTVVIQQRGLDMSVVALVALGGVMTAKLAPEIGSTFLGAASTILVAALLGIFNGLLISRLNVMSIVATLATNALYVGLVRAVSGNMALQTPGRLSQFVGGSVLGAPNSVLVAIALIMCVSIVIRTTRLGRNFLIVGAAPRVARAAGINLSLYQVGTYAFASVCFAIAGMLLSGVIGSASHLSGPDYLLPGIAAVVVGGTPFTGGKGSVVASAVAALFMVQLGQLVLSMGAGTAGQLLVQAVAIVVATSVQHLPWILEVVGKRKARKG